jgi:Tol biopolymer transport system component
MTMTSLHLAVLGLLAACVPMPAGSWGYGAGGPAGGGPRGQHDAVRPPERLVVTGAARGLQRLTSDPGHDTLPRLSADGTRLLAAYFRDEVIDGYRTGKQIDRHVISLRPDGRGRQTLARRGASARSPAWLPKTFVFVTDAMGGWQLVRAVRPTAGAAISVVVRAADAPEIGGISAAKDGALIAFHTRRRDGWMIGTVRADGTQLMLLGHGRNPSVGPDGTRVAFERAANGRWQIFTMDLDGEDLTQVTDLPGYSGNVTWSPDGQWLVFASSAGAERFRARSANATFNLFAIRPDGTGLTQLTNGPRKSTEPWWGSDGWIYFASDEAGHFDLWRLRPALDERMR